MGDRVDLADVGQELVAQALAAGRTCDQAGDVDELDRGRDHLLRLDDLGQRTQPWIRHRHDANVRLDRAERKVGRGDARLGQRVEKGRLADVRQADDAAFDAHVWIREWRIGNRESSKAGAPCSSDSRFPIPYSLLCVCNRFIASLKSPATASGSTSSASSIALAISMSSPAEARPRTQGVTRSLWPGWPMPMRRRWNFPCPSRRMVSRRPFWPPWPPSNFSRATPGGRSSSSCTSRVCSGSIFQNRIAASTDLPLRFIKVAGLSSQTPWPPTLTFTVSPNSLASTLKRSPHRSASASTKRNPALCRIRACSGPGLPSPTMSRRPSIAMAAARCARAARSGG